MLLYLGVGLHLFISLLVFFSNRKRISLNDYKL